MPLRLDSPQAAVAWLRTRVRGELVIDSRLLADGDGFIAWPGAAVDGRRFVHDALARGAAACLVEQDDVERFGFDSDKVACLGDLKAATGEIAAIWQRHPSEHVELLAITGSNGKTSSACWLAQALSGLPAPHRKPTAMIGTLGIGWPQPDALLALEDEGTHGLTTPDPVTLQRSLRRFADAGIRACAIEASSIGLAERRLDGCRIRLALFTNFSQDHLDYHGSMQAYWQAKRSLFDWPGLQAAVVNIDDPRGAELAGALDAARLDVWTVSRMRPARLQAVRIEQRAQGLRFEVREGELSCAIETGLLGDYNVSNLLGVLAALRALGVPLEHAARACATLAPVPGRMERVPAAADAPLVVVDFAHSPDALAQALGALQPLARERGGRLWCVFGCGGDRDQSKRPAMAAAVERCADQLVLTSDNPRSEDPQAIIGHALQGLKHPERATVEPDRAAAIRAAIARAARFDVLCIAGKGHEATQEIKGKKLPFSDRTLASEALAARRTPSAASCGNETRVAA